MKNEYNESFQGLKGPSRLAKRSFSRLEASSDPRKDSFCSFFITRHLDKRTKEAWIYSVKRASIESEFYQNRPFY